MLHSGEDIEFDGLIIATGVKPRPLKEQSNLQGIHTLRTLDDARALKSALAQKQRVLVVGAGVLGTEFAATARGLGMDVTLVGNHHYPLRQFGYQIGAKIADLHRGNGVELRLGTSVSVVLGASGKVSTVGLSTGEICSADLVVAAIGSVPATDWLEGSGLTVRDGIECDAFCQAAPDIFVAGDVANFWHQGYRRRMRIEHRMNATEQGAAAARNLLGAAQPFCPIPFVWSDQYNVKLQAYGVFPADGVFSMEDAGDGTKSITSCWQNDRLVGVIGWNSVKELRVRRQVIAEEMFLTA